MLMLLLMLMLILLLILMLMLFPSCNTRSVPSASDDHFLEIEGRPARTDRNVGTIMSQISSFVTRLQALEHEQEQGQQKQKHLVEDQQKNWR